MNRISELIADLIAELERSPQCPTMQQLHDLGLALHGSMCAIDAPELNWMDHTFEDVACCIPKAERCATIEQDEMERDHERKLRNFRLNGGL